MFDLNSFLSGAASPINDEYVVDSFLGLTEGSTAQKIIIECPNKRRTVTAILSEDVDLNISAEWGGSLLDNLNQTTFGSLGEMFSNVANLSGRTLHQPWMSRKSYKKTEPFKFTVPMRFVAIESGREEVWEPIVALCSFMYPRIVSGEDGGSLLWNKNETHPSNGVEYTELEKKTLDFISGVSTGLMQFAIPGANPFMSDSATGSFTGDRVSVTLGRFGKFNSVYIENLSGKISSVLDDEGYPVSAVVNVTFMVQDTAVVDSNGNFSFQGSEEVKQLWTTIDKYVSKVADWTNKFVRNTNTSWIQTTLNIEGSSAFQSLLSMFGIL